MLSQNGLKILNSLEISFQNTNLDKKRTLVKRSFYYKLLPSSIFLTAVEDFL